MNNFSWKEIISFLAKTGFVYQTSQIFGGFKNSWDYGPYGYLLKDRIIALWKQHFINNQTTFLIEANHILNPQTWIASSHVKQFSDYFTDCHDCKKRIRNDEIKFENNDQSVELNDYNLLIAKKKIACPYCNSYALTPFRSFNLLFETSTGALAERKQHIYLRPELAQGIFSNFMAIINSVRINIPFGIGQIGVAFRNEITTNSFLYKTRSFQLAELEFFVKPANENKYFDYYSKQIMSFLTTSLKLKNVRTIVVPTSKLAHYSRKTLDFEYRFNHKSYQEICGLANRSNYDLSAYNRHSVTQVYIRDAQTGEKYIPSVIEVSMGIDRLFLAVISQAYQRQPLPNNKFREVLQLPPLLTPYLVAINSLTKNQILLATTIYNTLRNQFSCLLMTKHSIGKRYRIQDALGVKYNITIDYQSTIDNKVTIRERDSMKQQRILITNVTSYLSV